MRKPRLVSHLCSRAAPLRRRSVVRVTRRCTICRVETQLGVLRREGRAGSVAHPSAASRGLICSGVVGTSSSSAPAPACQAWMLDPAAYLGKRGIGPTGQGAAAGVGALTIVVVEAAAAGVAWRRIHKRHITAPPIILLGDIGR